MAGSRRTRLWIDEARHGARDGRLNGSVESEKLAKDRSGCRGPQPEPAARGVGETAMVGGRKRPAHANRSTPGAGQTVDEGAHGEIGGHAIRGTDQGRRER